MNDIGKIVVIIAAYNVENRIEKCIASVQMQTYSNWAICVVDDGSTDSTGHLLDKIASTDTRISVLHVSNGGKSKARGIAIDAVKEGDYITFLDSDDELINENLFAICLREFLNDDVDIVSFNYLQNGRAGFEIKEKISLCTKKEKIKNMLTKKIMDGNIWGIYRYDIVKNNYKIMPYNHEDYRNKYDFVTYADKVVILPIIGYFYYMNAESITQRKITDKDGHYYIRAKKFIESILTEYSDLGEECNYFVADILFWTIMKLVQYKENRRLKIYHPMMKEFRLYVHKHIYNRNRYFTFKNKVTVYLIYLRLYGLVRIIHRFVHMIKNKQQYKAQRKIG